MSKDCHETAKELRDGDWPNRFILIAILFACIISNFLAPESAMADGYDHIVKQISRAAKSLKRKRIAVLQFPYVDGRASEGPRAVQERLTTKLTIKRGVQVIERASMGQLVDEIALGEKGLLDQHSSYQLGQILDVDAVVTGTLIELPNHEIQINARLIRIPDGLILAASESSVKRGWNGPSATQEPPPFTAWLESLLSPTASAFHSNDDINKFVTAKRDLLKSTASAMEPLKADPQFPIRPKGVVSAEILSATPTRGRWLYERDCTYCHGPQGRGVRAMAKIFGLSRKDLDLARKSLDNYSPQKLATTLKNGSGRMPARDRPIGEDEASALLQYLHYLVSINAND